MDVARQVDAQQLARAAARRQQALQVLEKYSRPGRAGVIWGPLMAGGISVLAGSLEAPWVVGAILAVTSGVAFYALTQARDNAKCLRAVVHLPGERERD